MGPIPQVAIIAHRIGRLYLELQVQASFGELTMKLRNSLQREMRGLRL